LRNINLYFSVYILNYFRITVGTLDPVIKVYIWGPRNSGDAVQKKLDWGGPDT